MFSLIPKEWTVNVLEHIYDCARTYFIKNGCPFSAVFDKVGTSEINKCSTNREIWVLTKIHFDIKNESVVR